MGEGEDGERDDAAPEDGEANGAGFVHDALARGDGDDGEECGEEAPQVDMERERVAESEGHDGAGEDHEQCGEDEGGAFVEFGDDLGAEIADVCVEAFDVAFECIGDGGGAVCEGFGVGDELGDGLVGWRVGRGGFREAQAGVGDIGEFGGGAGDASIFSGDVAQTEDEGGGRRCVCGGGGHAGQACEGGIDGLCCGREGDGGTAGGVSARHGGGVGEFDLDGGLAHEGFDDPFARVGRSEGACAEVDSFGAVVGFAGEDDGAILAEAIAHAEHEFGFFGVARESFGGLRNGVDDARIAVGGLEFFEGEELGVVAESLGDDETRGVDFLGLNARGLLALFAWHNACGVLEDKLDLGALAFGVGEEPDVDAVGGEVEAVAACGVLSTCEDADHGDVVDGVLVGVCGEAIDLVCGEIPAVVAPAHFDGLASCDGGHDEAAYVAGDQALGGAEEVRDGGV